jgi:hypothetical protein
MRHRIRRAEKCGHAYIVNHESTRTAMLYDRGQDDISLDEGERIAI